MPITLAQAAEQCGVNRLTLLRAVRRVCISGTRDDAGNWTIDPAEAFRAFPPRQPPQQAKADAATDALVAQLHRVIDDLRQDRDQWREQAQRLALPKPMQVPAGRTAAATACLPPAPDLALAALDGVIPMHWVVTFLAALAIMFLAGVGAMIAHHNFLQADSFGIGMGVFALVGAFMLYRVFFRRE